MRRFLRAMVVSAMVLAVSTAAVAVSETNPVRVAPTLPPTADVLVKLRSSQSPASEQMVHVAVRAGVTMRRFRPITNRLSVVTLDAADSSSLALALRQLRSDPGVEYADPDERRFPHALPDDPLFAGNGTPADSGQWYLQTNSSLAPAAVNAEAAWNLTGGSASLVIADLDTGVRFDHPDLLAVAANGRLLPGYDFISNVAIANDGNGRDADASDPGDWVTKSDTQTTQFKGCTVANSSWHGTRTAGVLGALTNNGIGVAGMTWSGRILPVRVLGKCGGLDSDIIAGMLWAAGISVSGVPDNPTPAKILNMSLGASGACPSAYEDAIQQVVALGVLVVVSAGNEGGPVDAPANCAGVAGVVGLRQAGTKVGYSSLGPEIAVGAPAGNCVNGTLTPQTPCEYSILTTVNLGTTVPATNGYTNTVGDPNLGTSFSAPIVSGIAALMAAVNTHLSACQLIARLKEGSQAFPQSSLDASTQPPACHVPTSSTDIQSSECICTADAQTCGTGMANAAGAVAAALRPIVVLDYPTSVNPGGPVSLSAQSSFAAAGHSIVSTVWTSTGAQPVTIQNGTSATATVTAPSCGYATVQVQITDDVGREDVASVVLSPTTVTSSAPTSGAPNACSASAPAPELAVCPAASTVVAGSAAQTFTASVANTTDGTVTWEVNGLAGGNAQVGTISTSGVYTPPSAVPSPATVTVEAVSQSDQSLTSSTAVTITTPPSSHGGGAEDGVTLAFGLLLLGAKRLARRQAMRCAASNHSFCARR